MSSNEDVIKPILDPLPVPCPSDELWLVSLRMAFVLDEIWRSRNQVVYNRRQVDLNEAIKHILQNVAEYSS